MSWRSRLFLLGALAAALPAGVAASRAGDGPSDRPPVASEEVSDDGPAVICPDGESPEGEKVDSEGSSRCELRSATGPRPKKAPPNPFRANLFENDFSYKKDPCSSAYVLGEELKEIPLDCLDDVWCLPKSTLSFGGEVRHRSMDEDNRLRPGGPGRSTYQLWRVRNYVDYNSQFVRAYVEGIDASSFGEELPETIIDVNRTDIQNAFVDLKLIERDGKPVVFRAGRMELQYGSQHLVSPLDWANTRRNFEGFLVSSKGDVWDVDAFVTRPVNSATLNKFRRTSFDHGDASRTFSGVYSTHHGVENHTVDVYWIWLREQLPVVDVPDGSRHTVGVRWAGACPIRNGGQEAVRQWDWDLEGGYQFGHDSDQGNVERRIEAGFVSANVGHTWMKIPWTPKLSGIYYWGSGDTDRFDSETNTFSVLFPLGHAYWGIIDNLAGQNLIDYGVQAQLKPMAKLTGVAAMHWFNLDSNADRLYTVAGVAVGPTGTSVNVGQEMDLVATYAFCPNFDVQAGYSWFWYGETITQTVLRRDDASQFYLQTTLRY